MPPVVAEPTNERTESFTSGTYFEKQLPEETILHKGITKILNDNKDNDKQEVTQKAIQPGDITLTDENIGN